MSIFAPFAQFLWWAVQNHYLFSPRDFSPNIKEINQSGCGTGRNRTRNPNISDFLLLFPYCSFFEHLYSTPGAPEIFYFSKANIQNIPDIKKFLIFSWTPGMISHRFNHEKEMTSLERVYWAGSAKKITWWSNLLFMGVGTSSKNSDKIFGFLAKFHPCTAARSVKTLILGEIAWEKVSLFSRIVCYLKNAMVCVSSCENSPPPPRTRFFRKTAFPM